MKTFPWMEFLQKHPIFATVRDEKRIQALLEDEVSSERTYARDEVIIRQGEMGHSIFVIGSGSAEAVLEIDGAAPILLSLMRAGEVFGEMALLERRARSATVRTRETSTVLEIGGTDFEQLMAEFPDIEFRLLLKMSERLRNAGQQVLAFQAVNLDEKLKVFNLKLDTEQRLVESSLKASQAMFDQTKLRADEVITSAERSRARLQWAATVIGGFITAAVAALGLVGAKQIWEISQVKIEAAQHAKDVETKVLETRKLRAEADEQSSAAKTAASEAATASAEAQKALAPLGSDLEKARSGLASIFAVNLLEAVDKRSGFGASRSYGALRGLKALGYVDLSEVLAMLDTKVVAPALPQKVNVTEDAKSFMRLLQCLVEDVQQAREKGKAYYLLLTYAIAIDQVPTKECEKDGTLWASRSDAYTAFQEFLRIRPEAKLSKSDISEELNRKVRQQTGSSASELERLNRLALTP